MSSGEESAHAFEDTPLRKRRKLNRSTFPDDIENDSNDDAFQTHGLTTDRTKAHFANSASLHAKSPKKQAKIKPQHLVQVHQSPVKIEDTFITQAPDIASSPARIKGAVWKQPSVREAKAAEPVAVPRARSPQQVPSPPSETFDLDEDVEFSTFYEGKENDVRGHTFESERVRGNAKLPSPHRRQSGFAADVAASQADFDIAQELADLPSDAFASSSASPEKSPQNLGDNAVSIFSQTFPSRRPNLAAPQKGLRQMTLFGDAAQRMSEASQATKRHNFPFANNDEKPTHHKLDTEAMRTWVYPTNLGTTRDYQFNIVAKGLYHNLLVALPTGLGKTFIAATIMLNWYRWTKDSQIVFVAPTKPLVSQQVEACFGIAGIPRSQTSMLTGGITPGLRAEEWATKRVFFMTPQTIINDLKTGICDPKKIVLLVVDEAHRATGNYAYVEVVKFLERFNQSFRVLALTATPGASVEAVQEVIDGLQISRVEIRTEFSLDIRQYVHSRKTESVTFETSEEMELVMDLFSKALQSVLNKLNGFNAYWSKDPMQLTAYGLTQARGRWMGSPAGKNANAGVKGMVNRIFTVLASLAHSIELLKFHGIGPFYHGMLNFRNTQEGIKGGKYEKEILENDNFQKMMTRLQFWINKPEFIGHPKLEYLQGVVLNHFLDAGEGRGATHGQPPSATRVMIFAHYRDSAEEIVRVLKRNEPMVRPHVFVGQAVSKGSEGMDQKRQLEIIQEFKNGKYNTLVATSIGEEGLDIGEIDLIICYDSSASPIRMLQRMGRTGRKRAGSIVLLLMKGKEENSFASAKDNYEKMQQMIAAGTRFNFHEDQSSRIIPREIQPVVDKRVVEIPVENTQADLPEPKKKWGRAPKRPPKKFHMPDGVRLGFVSASRMDGEDDDNENKGQIADRRTPRTPRKPAEYLESIPSLHEVLLTGPEETELKQKYQIVAYGSDPAAMIASVRFNAFPVLQRTLRPTRYVTHGRAATAVVCTFKAMHTMDQAKVDCFEQSRKQDINKLCGKDARVVDLEVEVVSEDEIELPPMPEPRITAPKPSKSALRAQKVAPPRPRGRSKQDQANGNDAIEAASSSPPRTSPGLQLQSQGISLGSDTSGEDMEEEPDSELRDFIVNDADIGPESSLKSSLPLAKYPQERFYISQNSVANSDSEDDELFQLPALVQTRLTDPEIRRTGSDVMAKPPPAAKRVRKIIYDSSD